VLRGNMSSQYVSLRDKQIGMSLDGLLGHAYTDMESAALYRILDLHSPTSTDNQKEEGLLPESLPLKDADEPLWKVLILDKTGMAIISSVLRVADLRSRGITVHLSLTSRRAAIQDVPAIYFLEPSSLPLVLADLKASIYSPIYIDFTSSVPRPLLEEFAGQVASANLAESISSVFGRPLSMPFYWDLAHHE
jgi:hypothetical protein